MSTPIETPLRVLVVEDDPVSAMRLHDCIKDADAAVQVEVVARLSEAIGRLSSHDIDAILLDLGLPDAADLEALRVVRAVAPGVPVLVITGDISADIETQALALGATAFHRKAMLDSARILERVQLAVRRAHARAPAAIVTTMLQLAAAKCAAKLDELDRAPVVLRRNDDATLLSVAKDIEAISAKYGTVWSGIVARGYIEAARLGHMKKNCDSWILSHESRLAYAEIEADLKTIFALEKKRLNRSPTDDELAWAIEAKHQAWMIAHACPTLGVNSHGCLAIASIIAREG